MAVVFADGVRGGQAIAKCLPKPIEKRRGHDRHGSAAVVPTETRRRGKLYFRKCIAPVRAADTVIECGALFDRAPSYS